MTMGDPKAFTALRLIFSPFGIGHYP